MVVIWLNINHSMGYGYHSFGLGYAKILRNGLSIADTVFAYNVWRNCLQELHFSWPVTMFYIMYLNIWSQGNILHNNEDG